MDSVFSDTTLCIIALIIQTFILAVFTYFSKTAKRHQNRLFIASYVVMWFFCIYNIVYTGILGWNIYPVTPLEEKLDNIFIAGFLTGVIMNLIARFVLITEDGKIIIKI